MIKLGIARTVFNITPIGFVWKKKVIYTKDALRVSKTWANFFGWTNPLKLYCQVLLKNRSEELALKSRRQLFLHLTLLNMHFKEFSFQAQNLWEESIKINYVKIDLLMFVLLVFFIGIGKLLVFAAL